jgi:uncharacterized protein
MDTLLEELYKTELSALHHIDRKVRIGEESIHLYGGALSGKTQLVKSYLLTHKKSTYLYIDLDDIRIDTYELNKAIFTFCAQNDIHILVLDNYKDTFQLPQLRQVITVSRAPLLHNEKKQQQLFPLDFEEFLAFEKRFDDTVLSHFLQLGGFSVLRGIPLDSRMLYIQHYFRSILTPAEFILLQTIAEYAGRKLSVFQIYQKLKLTQKISKDTLYKDFETMQIQNYFLTLEKFEHLRAPKKVYLGDIVFKHALSSKKNFAALFENTVFLELFKAGEELFYSEKIEFYLPKKNKIILCIPFADERTVFKRIESIEAFIASYQVQVIECVTMNKNASLSHPFSRIEILPFTQWALSD